jgi:sugar-specific transcriptional regulator TrmB
MQAMINKLTSLGLNKLEAEVYVYLLSNPGQTAYKIGKQLNKATANVYKAIDQLAVHGAVLIEENKNKQCIPVSPKEFFNHYIHTLTIQSENLIYELENLNVDYSEEKSYSINNVSLVFERFNQMMKRCTTIAVVDAFPQTLPLVKDIIEETTARGIAVHLEIYEPALIQGAQVTCANMGQEVTNHWKSQQLNLVIDGNEHLTALFDNSIQNIKHATWSNNTYLSCLLHAGMLREQGFLKIMQTINEDEPIQKIKNIIQEQKFFFNSDIPGFNKLKNI